MPLGTAKNSVEASTIQSAIQREYGLKDFIIMPTQRWSSLPSSERTRAKPQTPESEPEKPRPKPQEPDKPLVQTVPKNIPVSPLSLQPSLTAMSSSPKVPSPPAALPALGKNERKASDILNRRLRREAPKPPPAAPLPAVSEGEVVESAPYDSSDDEEDDD